MSGKVVREFSIALRDPPHSRKPDSAKFDDIGASGLARISLRHRAQQAVRSDAFGTACREKTMEIVRFIRTATGRLLRVAAGAAISWYGVTQIGGTSGLAVAAVGVVPIAAGVFNVCLVGPLFGVTLMGQPSR